QYSISSTSAALSRPTRKHLADRNPNNVDSNDNNTGLTGHSTTLSTDSTEREPTILNERPRKRARAETYDSDKENKCRASSSNFIALVIDADEVTARSATEELADTRSTPEELADTRSILADTGSIPDENSTVYTPTPVNPTQLLPSVDLNPMLEDNRRFLEDEISLQGDPNDTRSPPDSNFVVHASSNDNAAPQLSLDYLETLLTHLDGARQLLESAVKINGEPWASIYASYARQMNARSLENSVLQPGDCLGGGQEARLYNTFKTLRANVEDQRIQVLAAKQRVENARCRVREARFEASIAKRQIEVAKDELNEAYCLLDDAEGRNRAAKRGIINAIWGS
ncbi:hypothetical protein BGX28_010425, partial [Mortierella sp. GBA30]